ncbi:Cyclophilin [Aphelenchoides fujianensis]|nr:Cyclophilin [Aphelenchoides fujianensis]
MSSVRRRCFFDVAIDGDLAGRIVFELYDDIAPETTENFLQLCTGQAGIGKTTGKPLTYKGTAIHRVVKNFMIQGGDFSAGNGSGGESIYGGTFDDETFSVKHDQPFLLSMANRQEQGPNTNGSQFFILTNAAPHLNDVHVAFGRVISGQEVVTKIEQLKTGAKSRPVSDVIVANCGQLVLKSKGDEADEEGGRPQQEEGEEAAWAGPLEQLQPSSSEDEKEKEEKGPNGVNVANVSSVRKEDLPEVPETNNWLMRDRRSSPKKHESRPSGDRRDDRRDRRRSRSPRRDRNGAKVKGRGRLTYRSPSRDGSTTPPHWKQEQRRLISISELKNIQEKQREIAARQAAREERHRLEEEQRKKEEEERKRQQEAEQPPPREDRRDHSRERRRPSPVAVPPPEERRHHEEERNERHREVHQQRDEVEKPSEDRRHEHPREERRDERRHDEEDRREARRRGDERKDEERRRDARAKRKLAFGSTLAATRDVPASTTARMIVAARGSARALRSKRSAVEKPK